ncbi:MAG: hypothetical protein KY476_09395 [Planctomycetes bacterium]|nr:hypothetical protein [Planctomycetota bacterium]
MFQPRRLAGLAALLLIATAAPAIVQWLPNLRALERYSFDASAIELQPPVPRWVPPAFVEQVLSGPAWTERRTLLDETLARDLFAAFHRHPWVHSVERVQLRADGRVTIELEFRRPVAIVDVQDGVYPIDAAGILLPPNDFSPADALRLPRVENVRTLPQGPAGMEWGDSAVSAAARLAAVLLESDPDGASWWTRWNLATIRLPDRRQALLSGEDALLEVATSGGSLILWGRPPGSTHPGELTVEQKLGRLRQYVRDFGSFDRPQGPYEIDIRHWNEISRRPLAAGGRVERR